MRAIKGFWLIVILSAFMATPTAQAAVTINVYQVGSGVQIVGSGSLDLSTAVIFNSTTGAPQFNAITNPYVGVFPSIYDAYSVTNVVVSGASPTANPFTQSLNVDPTKGVFINPGYLYVPQGYVSNTPLDFTASITNYVFSNYGFSDGDFINVTWTIGATSESLQMNFHVVPEPSSLTLLALAAIGGYWMRRKKA